MPGLFITTPVAADLAISNGVLSRSNAFYKEIEAFYTAQYNAVWKSKNATPQQVITRMGTNAAKLFSLAAELATILIHAGSDVPTTTPAEYSVTINADGSATVTVVAPPATPAAAVGTSGQAVGTSGQ
jgi:hypothetical protein